MIATIIKGLPVIIGIVIGAGGVIGIDRLTQDKIVIPPCPQPPACNCPPQANTIDFDKIKGYKGTISLDQHYHVDVGSDSVGKIFRGVLREELRGVKGYKPIN